MHQHRLLHCAHELPQALLGSKTGKTATPLLFRLRHSEGRAFYEGE